MLFNSASPLLFDFRHSEFASPFFFFLANRDLLPGDSRGYRSAEEAARELTQGIRREGTKLAERWAALRDRTERWSVDLDTTTNVNIHIYLFKKKILSPLIF